MNFVSALDVNGLFWATVLIIVGVAILGKDPLHIRRPIKSPTTTEMLILVCTLRCRLII